MGVIELLCLIVLLVLVAMVLIGLVTGTPRIGWERLIMGVVVIVIILLVIRAMGADIPIPKFR